MDRRYLILIMQRFESAEPASGQPNRTHQRARRAPTHSAGVRMTGIPYACDPSRRHTLSLKCRDTRVERSSLRQPDDARV